MGSSIQLPTRTHDVVVNGTRLHFSERGEGPPLVILHGLQDTERTWWRVANELAPRHRVFALDLPGCGLSARPDASYTLDWQAQLVAAWLDSLRLPQLDLVGHSFGGGLAMWLLLYRPQLIRRLALVAPGGLGRNVGVALRLASLPGVESLGQPWMGTTTSLMTAFHGAELATVEREYLRRVNSQPGSARAFARTVHDVIDYRGQTRHFLDRAHEVPALPVMALFWGERDHVIPIEQGEHLCAQLRHTPLFRFPGHGHFLHWSAPRRLAVALLRYLDAPNSCRAELAHVQPALARVAQSG